MSKRNIERSLIRIESLLVSIRDNIVQLIQIQGTPPSIKLPDSKDILLALPDFLRTSLLAPVHLDGEATATEVASVTKRVRAVALRSPPLSSYCWSSSSYAAS